MRLTVCTLQNVQSLHQLLKIHQEQDWHHGAVSVCGELRHTTQEHYRGTLLWYNHRPQSSEYQEHDSVPLVLFLVNVCFVHRRILDYEAGAWGCEDFT